MNQTSDTPAAEPVDWGRIQRWSFLAALGGLSAFVFLGIVNLMGTSSTNGMRTFFLTYSVGFACWFVVTYGSIALRTIHHLCGTSWGLLLRPMFVGASKGMYIMPLLFLPIAISFFIGNNSPYWWARPVEEPIPQVLSEELGGVEAQERAIEDARFRRDNYLNPPFTLGRAAIYFLIWIGFVLMLNRWVGGDREGDGLAHEKLKNMSGPFLIFWAIIGTFAATDWFMSLEPAWSSTMFPVVFGVTCMLSCLVFSASILLSVLNYAPLAHVVRDKHKIDVGSLTLALTMVWSYTSFSQFLLVWVANLPEEIPFFLKRTKEGWEWVSRALCILFFGLGLLLLLFRDIKKNPVRLRRMTLWLLFMSFVNVLWWILPALPHPDQYLHVPMAIAAVIGVGGIWGWWFARNMKDVPLLVPHEALMVEGEYHRELHHGH